MDALDNLAKIYVKFYICQIHSSISYPRYKKSQQNYEELIVDQINLMNEIDNNSNGNSNSVNKKDNDSNNNNNNNNTQLKIEDEDEKEKYPKKLFVFKNKIFSRVEIQGLIVQIQTRGQGDYSRKIIYLDDTTSIIQVIIWKNKMINSYEQIEKLFGSYIRVLGQADFFSEKFEIVAERIQPITKAFNETLFHITLQNNQKCIFNISISQLLKNAFDEINESSSNKTKESNGNLVNIKYIELLKEYSNRLLACFEGFYLDGVVEDSFGFTKIPIKLFMNNINLTEMLKDFCGSVYDTNKFLLDSFVMILEPQMQGKLIYDPNDSSFLSAYIEIKSNNSKIKNEIYNFIKRKNEESAGHGTTYMDIFQYISTLHNNFYTHDYLKFIIKKMTDNDMHIISLGSNSYSISN